MAGELEVRLVTPEREVWSGRASLVLARTLEGELGILPGHEALVGVLDIAPVHIDTSDGRMSLAVEGGYLHVLPGPETTRVDLLVEYAERAGEIDPQALAGLEQQAAEVQASDPEEAKRLQARIALRRQLQSS